MERLRTLPAFGSIGCAGFWKGEREHFADILEPVL